MRPPLSFDGFGINGPDEHRTRIATFAPGMTELGRQHYGKLFEASPRMYDALASIRALRDELAEGLPWPSRGALPEGVPTPQPGQCFDDWAADVAEWAMPGETA